MAESIASADFLFDVAWQVHDWVVRPEIRDRFREHIQRWAKLHREASRNSWPVVQDDDEQNADTPPEIIRDETLFNGPEPLGLSG